MTEPTNPEELSSRWLTQALGFAVEDFAVEYFSEGAGVMAWVMRLRLKTAPGLPDTVIAKFPSPAEANREVALTYDMYEREIDFYRDIAGNIALQTPQCYHASFEHETQQFVLLMEDIGHLRIGDQVAGCNLTEVKAVLDALAQMHASGWGADKFPGLRSHDNPAQRAGMVGAVGFGWPVILEQFGEYVPDVAKAAVDRLPAAVPRLLEQMCDGPVCLTHADVRLDNIFFNDDGTQAQFVDWQSVCTSA
ncbi:MAG: phosphotransferase, partial [Pseudomonadales bacterium]